MFEWHPLGWKACIPSRSRYPSCVTHVQAAVKIVFGTFLASCSILHTEKNSNAAVTKPPGPA